MDREQPAAGSEAARQRGEHVPRLELDRRPQPVRLRCDDQIVIGPTGAALRPHLVEQEA